MIRSESLTRTKYILLSLFAATTFSASAQWTEAGAWASASVNGELVDDLDFSVSAASRWDMDVTRLGLAFVSAELGYKLPHKISISADYRQGTARTDEMQWEGVQRTSVDLKWKQKLNKKLDLGLRMKAQSGFKGPISYLAQTTFSTALRFRPSLYIDLPKGRSVVTSVEFFVREDNAQYFWTDTRYRISLKDKVAKRKYLTISYLYEKERGGPDPWSYHVISADFSVKWKRKTVDK